MASVGREMENGVHYFCTQCLSKRVFAMLLGNFVGYAQKSCAICAKILVQGTAPIKGKCKPYSYRSAQKVTMPNKSNTPQLPPVCQYCGKKLTKGASVKNLHGTRCAAMQAQFTPAKLQTHYAKISVAVTPQGFITVGNLHKVIVAKKHNVPGLTIAKMVKGFGTDRASKPPVHPIMQVYYLPNRHRVINGWLATSAGLQAMATGNFSAAPTQPKISTI